MGPRFNTEFDPRYGELVNVSPLLRRIVCRNPSKFTFYGTGTYVIGRGDVAVVDPGPRDDAHIEALLRALDGERVRHVLVTHTHGDHSPASAAVADATGAPVLGFGPHPVDARSEQDDDSGEENGAEVSGTFGNGVEGTDDDPDDPGNNPTHSASTQGHHSDVDFEPDVALQHSEIIDGPGYTVEALHTPGHISNHLCFALREEHCVLSGDHVMGWSTTIIPPPDGDMAAYLESLRLLLDRPGEERLYPTHGGPVDEASEYISTLYRHRLDREAGIIGQLRKGPLSATQIVAELYAAIDRKLHKPAARSVVAHLRKLREEGRARPVDRTASEIRDSTIWELI